MDHRRELANGREIWVIKAGFPETPEKIYWSEYIFSHTMKKYLERLGFYVEIESRDEYSEEKEADVVISLRGPAAYYPDRSIKNRIYIMWNLSHPDTVTEEEYNLFDVVCVGSEKKEFLEKLQNRLQVPVICVPMCVDTELFYPDPDPYGKKQYDWIFVGNSRYVKRKCVDWAIKNGIPLKIWGKNWEHLIEDGESHIMAKSMPNDKLRELYWDSKMTVNDHFEDMLANGFISTRIVEALASGLPVISDYSEIFEENFRGAVLCYKNEDEYAKQLKVAQQNYKQIKEKAMDLWPMIQERYSFDGCMRRMAELKEEIACQRQADRKRVFCFSEGTDEIQDDQMNRFYLQLEKLRKSIVAEQDHNRAEEICKVEINEIRENAIKAFKKLSWSEQLAFQALEYPDKYIFRTSIEEYTDSERAMLRLQEKTESLTEELKQVVKWKEDNKILSQKVKEAYAQKAEVNQKLQKEYARNREVNQKLQRTYDEKSEINRKLQITYDEKYERGVEIKKLKKQIESIKMSRTYKLASVIGAPVRIMRRLFWKDK